LKVPAPLPSKLRKMAFSEAHGSTPGDQPNSKKLAVACVSLGKKLALGLGWKVVRMPTCVSIAAIAWHTAARKVTFTQSRVMAKPSG